MIDKERLFAEFKPVLPREYVNFAIIDVGKWERYVCQKIDVPHNKGWCSVEVIKSRRTGLIVYRFVRGVDVEAARDWLLKIRTAPHRSRNERAAFIHQQRLTPALAVWTHHKRK